MWDIIASFTDAVSPSIEVNDRTRALKFAIYVYSPVSATSDQIELGEIIPMVPSFAFGFKTGFLNPV